MDLVTLPTCQASCGGIHHGGVINIMSNQLYRLEIQRTKTHIIIRAVGRGPRGHCYTLKLVEVPLAEYRGFMEAGGMEKFLEPVAAASRRVE